MNVRNLQNSDIPILLDMHIKSGLGYEFPNLRSPHMEAIKVVTDEHGDILSVAAAERILQLYLFCGEFEHPAAKLAAVRLLHDEMRPILKAKGYNDANGFIPPQYEKQFGPRLIRTFGYQRNWPSYCIRF